MENPRSRGWLLTIFEQPEGKEKRTESDIADMLDPLPWMGQLEEGHETHHRHFQIYVEAPNPIHFSSLKKKIPDAHIEPRHGSKKQAFDYCSKSDTRIAGPFFHGIDEPGAEPTPGQRMDLSMISDALLAGKSVDDLLLNPEFSPRLARCMTWARSIESAVVAKKIEQYQSIDRDVEVHYIWGASRLGKTYSIVHIPDPDVDDDDVPRYVPVYEPEVVGDSLRWDGYAGEDIILLDEFDGSIRLGLLNRILEGYHNTHIAARFHNGIACYHVVFIVSNYAPETFYHGESSWLNRLTTVEHADWYSLRHIEFAHGECEDDWDTLLNPHAPGSAVDESLWKEVA